MDILQMLTKSILIFSLLLARCTCFPGSPRIYNVLINSKKNLVTSQAVSIYQPVLKTTSVGIALPTISYTIPESLFPRHVQFYNEDRSRINLIPEEDLSPMFFIANAIQASGEPKKNENS